VNWYFAAGVVSMLVGVAGAFATGAIMGGRRMYVALGGGEVERLRAERVALAEVAERESQRTLRQLGEWQSRTVWGVHVDDRLRFHQGDQPLSELHELVTAKECQGYVDRIEDLTKTVGSLNVHVAALTRALEAAEKAPAPAKPRRRAPKAEG
jgi:hypothetical protein